MKTDALIAALAADNARVAANPDRIWARALPLAVAVATLLFVALLGPRPDIAAAAETVRFLFKFALTGVLAATAFVFLRRIARPDAGWSPHILLAAPLLALTAVAIELVALPTDAWATAAIGTNALVCLTYIPLIGIGPLAILVVALRRGAPMNPSLAGAAAGAAAGGIAAFLYAAHCTDDSPLFVAVWYTLAIGILAAIGGLAGRRFVRW